MCLVGGSGAFEGNVYVGVGDDMGYKKEIYKTNICSRWGFEAGV